MPSHSEALKIGLDRIGSLFCPQMNTYTSLRNVSQQASQENPHFTVRRVIFDACVTRSYICKKTILQLSSGIVSYRLGSDGAAAVCFPYGTSAWFCWRVSQWGSQRCLWGHAASPHWRDAPELTSALQSPHQHKDLPAGKSHHRYHVYDCIHPSFSENVAIKKKKKIIYLYICIRFLFLLYFIQDVSNRPLLCICFQSQLTQRVLSSVLT